MVPSVKTAFPRRQWRLVITPFAHGAWNMAVDEAILTAVGRAEALPTLRLYGWNPPCLSLGYAQPVSDVDRRALSDNGWQLVRRPTGGRAILHTDELTYAVIGPQNEPRLAGSVLESYRVIAQALLRALELLGIEAKALEKSPAINAHSQEPLPENMNSAINPVCFETPSNYEITTAGKKLIGSAQARRKEGVLQHGSLPLKGDLTRIVYALDFPDDERRQIAASRLLERAATAEGVLGYPLDWENAAQAFVSAFGDILNLELQPSNLLQSELMQVELLLAEKFANREWTERV